jgi:hypothetical protein
MGMANHRSMRGIFGTRIEQGFQAARGAVKEKGPDG